MMGLALNLPTTRPLTRPMRRPTARDPMMATHEPVAEELDADVAGEAHRRRDRHVGEVARVRHEGHAHGDDADEGHRVDDVEHVLGGKEIADGAGGLEEGAQGEEEHGDAVDARRVHDARRTATARSRAGVARSGACLHRRRRSSMPLRCRRWRRGAGSPRCIRCTASRG